VEDLNGAFMTGVPGNALATHASPLVLTGLLAPPLRRPEEPARPVRVLVVDDEEDIREAVQTLLPRVVPGVEVATAESAGAALEAVQRERYDLDMSDYRMPGGDGLELLREVRRTDARIPLVLFTAYPERRLASEAAQLHIDFVTKPLGSRELQRVVERALSRGEAAGG
jgi:DNA-binding NtrC family response regulator